MPKLLVTNDDVSEDSDDNASTSKGSMPKLLIRKDYAEDKNFDK